MKKLLNHEDILEAIPTSGNSVRLAIKDLPRPVSIATMSAHRVELNQVPDEYHEPNTEFLLNIPKDAFFSEELLAHALDVPLGVGGVGDLYTAVGEKEFRLYIPKETRFILRGLAQHIGVRNVTRLNSRTYQIFKHSGEVVRVLALNEYDLTSDALRSGIEKFGRPDLVLASNPNCRLSTDTQLSARTTGTRVLSWRQLLGALSD